MNVQTITIDPVDGLLNKGLKNLWYAVCPSDFVKTQPVSVRRFGRKIALWRDAAGQVHALEDHCPHRGAPLSQGVIDRKSTRLNSSHTVISYAVFCLKKKKKKDIFKEDNDRTERRK